VARVPKRTDMFARAQFGDMGKALQDGAKGGYYARKAAPSMGQRRVLGAFVLLQDGESAAEIAASPATRSATREHQGGDLFPRRRRGRPVALPGLDLVFARRHRRADRSAARPGDLDDHRPGLRDDGGRVGDDWISVAQSMRAYLRFSLLGGVIAKQIRNLGYKAKAHTVLDGEVLQPPLLLLSGLGEVSRIGEVILNPYLGPRLKSGVVTTDMPMAHDRPIDFGLQNFCENCNKCARECPSGAITAGPKLMFNGYEIWKSDSQKCATYRITTEGGAMCGRCMKTCPWNLEGLFAEAPFRWAAIEYPGRRAAAGEAGRRGRQWRAERRQEMVVGPRLEEDGGYRPTKHPVNRRDLQTDLDLKYEDQTLAVYPANLAPHPWPYPFPMDREKGIEAYQAMITAEEYRRGWRGDESHVHRYTAAGESPVLRVVVSKAEKMTGDVTKYEFRALDGSDLPEWEAGAHLDIVVAPEFLRQYSMSGDPADRSVYQIGVLREDEGRGGSKLMHRIFTRAQDLHLRPINHFPLDETATKTFLMGGGIGITPMIAMAHRLHAIGADFACIIRSSRASGGVSRRSGACAVARPGLCACDRRGHARRSRPRAVGLRGGLACLYLRAGPLHAGRDRGGGAAGLPGGGAASGIFLGAGTAGMGEPSVHAAAGEIGPGIPRARGQDGDRRAGRKRHPCRREMLGRDLRRLQMRPGLRRGGASRLRAVEEAARDTQSSFASRARRRWRYNRDRPLGT
jgi:ferredoxin